MKFTHMLIAAVAVATMAFAGAAWAAEAKGAIKAIDAAKKTITLDDGKVYTFATPNPIAGVSVGQTVIITFTAAGAANNGELVRIYVK